MRLLSRRTLLESAVRGAAGLSLGLWGVRSPSAFAQSAGGGAIDLGGGFRVLTAGDTNVLAVTAGDGVALVDGGAAAESAALLQRVAALPGGGKVHTLFNTHWHPEQTGSNEVLAKAGATIVSQMNTKNWLSTDVTWPWNNETVEPLPEPARPSKTFYSSEDFEVGGKRVQCGHLRDCPHTDGDMYVFFPDDNVLAIGDAITGAGWPSIDWWTGARVLDTEDMVICDAGDGGGRHGYADLVGRGDGRSDERGARRHGQRAVRGGALGSGDGRADGPSAQAVQRGGQAVGARRRPGAAAGGDAAGGEPAARTRWRHGGQSGPRHQHGRGDAEHQTRRPTSRRGSPAWSTRRPGSPRC